MGQASQHLIIRQEAIAPFYPAAELHLLSMRQLYFLLPGTSGKFAGGGLWAELKTFQLAQKICTAEIVTYRQREKDTLFLEDLLKNHDLSHHSAHNIFIISWGFDVPKLAAKLKGYPVVYHAHSTGYGFKIPASIPIITVSRNSMGYWGQNAPNALIYYLPNQISDEFYNQHLTRDIDVLVQTRKASEYLLKELVPALQKRCHVSVIDSYVEDLPGLFNRAKVYLYDSAEYWAMQGVSEGFGLQPLEALACGCQVFSSINHGLSDFLDPAFNCHKIAGYSREYDVQRILNAVKDQEPALFPESVLAEYREANILHRLQVILTEINTFFDCQPHHVNNIPSLTLWRRLRLFWQRVTNKFRKRYFQKVS